MKASVEKVVLSLKRLADAANLAGQTHVLIGINDLEMLIQEILMPSREGEPVPAAYLKRKMKYFKFGR